MAIDKNEQYDSDYEALLDTTTYKLHEIIVEFLNALSMQVDSNVADDILINALAVNLGNVIGHMDANSQNKYSALSRAIIKEYTLLGTIHKDLLEYGQIGRA